MRTALLFFTILSQGVGIIVLILLAIWLLLLIIGWFRAGEPRRTASRKLMKSHSDFLELLKAFKAVRAERDDLRAARGKLLTKDGVLGFFVSCPQCGSPVKMGYTQRKHTPICLCGICRMWFFPSWGFKCPESGTLPES